MRLSFLAVCLLASAACAVPAAPPAATAPPPFAAGKGDGVLVMAHGGSAEWNQAVAEAVAPLRARLPTALALGMADPVTLQSALDTLTGMGVGRVAVVRLFLSGSSFLHQTEYLFGLRPDPPADPLLGHGHGPGDPGAPGLRPLRHTAQILLGGQGLGESEIARRILQHRVEEGMARTSTDVRVLLLAHGMGAESENQAVLRDMSAVADVIHRRGVGDVQVATLREDWPDERAMAEERIRAWVGADEGGETMVVPFRLFGFGPYAEVLDGLNYSRTEGLLPHALVGEWVEAQALGLLGRGARVGSHGSRPEAGHH